MTHADILAMSRGYAPVIKAYVALKTNPLIERIAVLEKSLAALEEAATKPGPRP